MNLDRRTFQDHQRQFQFFLVHLKSLSTMLRMTLLSGTNPPIHQKIPLDVSSCHLQGLHSLCVCGSMFNMVARAHMFSAQCNAASEQQPEGWRIVDTPPCLGGSAHRWVGQHTGGSRLTPTVHRCPQGMAVGGPCDQTAQQYSAQTPPNTLAFQPLGDCQAHLPNPRYRMKQKVAGGMTVRFPTIRRLPVTGSAFSRELRTNSP